MTDTNTEPTPTQPGAPIVAQTDGTPPDAGGENPLANMTAEQIDAIAARVEEARKNRPPSVAQQLEALQQSLQTGTAELEDRVKTKKTARDDADAIESQLKEIRGTLRKTELVEAARAAGFKAPDHVADILSKTNPVERDSNGVYVDVDVTELVKNAAASGAFAMTAPAPSADVGGQSSKTPAGMDPGRAALMAEIKAAQGR